MTCVFEWIAKNYYEVIASIAGFIGVWLTARQNIWCWIIGLINVIFSIFVFFNAQFYAAVILQFFYLFITIFGWYNWHKGNKDGTPLKVSKLKTKGFYIIILIFILCVSIAGYVLDRYTGDPFPYLDSFATVGGIISTFLSARKIIENWLFWIFIDAVATGMYLSKGLYAFFILYFIYCIMAFYGYFQWKKSIVKV